MFLNLILSEILASSVEVVLVEEDVPGAALRDRLLEELTVPELQRWLACWGASRSECKCQLIQRVKDYVQSRMGKDIVDPDKGEIMEAKRQRLGIVLGTCDLPPLALKGEWVSGLTDVPHLKHSQVHSSLLPAKPSHSMALKWELWRRWKLWNISRKGTSRIWKHIIAFHTAMSHLKPRPPWRMCIMKLRFVWT